MTQVIEFSIPPTGESVDTARLVNWVVPVGQCFAEGDILFEIETDKSVIEIPAPAEGRLVEQLIAVDTVFEASSPVARIELASAQCGAEAAVTVAKVQRPVADEVAFRIPPTGEDLESVRLVQWLVQPGEAFAAGDVLLEIETDKSVIEIPAPCDGTLLEHLSGPDSVFDVATPVARLRTGGELACDKAVLSADLPSVPAAQARVAAVRPPQTPAPVAASAVGRAERIVATPAARREMAARGLAQSAVRGSGPGGRITLADVRPLAAQPEVAPGARGIVGVASSAIGPFIDTSAGRMHVRFRAASAARPQAATVVLIHGLFGDADTWSGLVSALNRDGIDVLAIDLPCHGRSDAVAIGFEAMVAVIAETLAVLDGRPVVLVGHSFGGAVVSRLARTPGVDVRAVVLISPLGLCTEIAQDFLGGMTNARSKEALHRELLKLTATGVMPSAAYVAELADRLAARHELLREVCSGISWNGVQQVDVTADLNGLNCPVSLLHGRQDRVIPWQGALNAPPQVALHLIPGVGHMPQWEASGLTIEVILRAAA